jgi:hypothetical protein
MLLFPVRALLNTSKYFIVCKGILRQFADPVKRRKKIHFVAQATDGFAMHLPMLWRHCTGFIE